MTLLASFTHPVADVQRAFRRILKAMSEPGVQVSLPSLPGWGRASPAATAVLMALVDRETPVYIDDALKDEALLANLRFHTGAPVTGAEAASFALLHAGSAQDIASFIPEDEGASGKSTTVIIEVAALSGGLTLRLSGSGLLERRAIAPQLPESVLRYLRARPHRYPQGIDLIFTCGENMMALPRTTDVVVC
ncbi:phosphonate C-P lyase system protein PhnH [Erwinia sp. P6884]|uniref:phosphonate C-P lyase system protein PhnH n=1 Tax=Erwinia sp. P6884 TaxID=3141450 RepID=UPI00318B2519